MERLGECLSSYPRAHSTFECRAESAFPPRMLLHLTSYPSYSSASYFLGPSSSLLRGLVLRYAVLVLVVIPLLFPTRTFAQTQVPNSTIRNVTIPIDSSQIIYTPFLCDRNTSVSQCNGGWCVYTTLLSVGPPHSANALLMQQGDQREGQ